MQQKNIVRAILVFSVILAMLSYYLAIENKHIKKTTFNIIGKDSTLNSNINIYGVSLKNILVSTDEEYYCKDYVFVGDTAAIKNIFYIVNELPNRQMLSNFFFKRIINPTEKFLHLNKNLENENFYSVVIPNNSRQSHFPFFNKLINWGGDASFICKLLLHPLFLFALLVFLLQKRLHRFYNILSPKTLVASNDYSSGLRIVLIVVPFLLLSLIILINDKYYFLQDDNYAQFTPLLLNGLEEWYNTGIFPTYNAYQGAGLPVFETGTNSFLYPLTHIAYIIAKYLCNDELQFNNIFALLHFFIGYLFTYKTLRLVGIHFWLALSAAFGFVFCGFNLETVRSWYYVAPTIAYLPLLFFLIYSYRKCSLKWQHCTVAIVLLTTYFYSGNFQFFTYTIIFCVILFYTTHHSSITYKTKFVTIILITSIILFLPQAISTYLLVKNLDRNGGAGLGILNGFMGLISPLFNKDIAKPNGWGSVSYRQYSGYFYSSAFVFMSIAFSVIFLFLFHTNNTQFTTNKFIKTVGVFFVITFFLAIGKCGLLWHILSKLPMFNKFNHPFKFLLYVQFFGVVFGCYFLQKIVYSKNIPLFFCLAFISMLFSFYNASQTKDAFYIYAAKHNSYAELPYSFLMRNNSNYRVASFAVTRCESPQYSNTLMHNFASIYKINSVQAYEPLVAAKFKTVENTGKHSIRYFIRSTLNTHKQSFKGNVNGFNTLSNKDSLANKWSSDSLMIWEDKNYDPLVQLLDSTGKRVVDIVEVINKNNGIQVQLEKPVKVASIVLSYNAMPQLYLYINGKKVIYTTDAYNRMSATVNCEVKSIVTKYKPFPFSMF